MDRFWWYLAEIFETQCRIRSTVACWRYTYSISCTITVAGDTNTLRQQYL